MRKINFFGITLVIALLINGFLSLKTANAVTAYPHPIEFTQPDGNKVTVIMKGDEKIKWASTVDGYTLMYNQQGFLEYAIINEKGDMVPSGVIAKEVNKRQKEDIQLLQKVEKGIFYSKDQVAAMKSIWEIYQKEGEKAFPTTGNRKLICILIGYTDRAFTKTQAEFNNLFNQVGYTTGGATGSVKDFYLESSYNQFNLTVDVAGPFTAANNMAYYGGNDAYGDDLRPRELVTEACYLANPTVNFADYDNDNDGAVDAVYVIFAGYGEEAGGGANCIWSHAWNISTITLDGKTISRYSCSPELRGNSGTNITRIGVICHEFGHVLGAPDFYDTDYATGGQFEGTGEWDMMAGGSWNNGGATPAQHNAYTKIYKYSWATATLLSTGTVVTLQNACQYSNSFYRYNTTTTNEYFLCENRQLVGFDAYLPGHGLIIYHVHANVGTSPINSTHPQKMYPVCASATTNPSATPSDYGNINSGGCPFPGTSNKTSFTDVTTPHSKSWAGANTGKPVTSITENTVNKTITFTFMGGSPCTQPTTQASNFGTSTITQNSMTVSWTRGNGNNVLVVARAGSAVDADPLSGTSYTANATFGLGTQIGSGNYVVYNGTGTSVNVTGLTMGTNYHFALYEYNTTGTCYKFPALVGNATTSCNIISTFPYNEGFENAGNIPACWTQEATTPQWVFITGNGGSNPATAHGGTYNACLKDNSSTSNRNKLVTPQINFTGYTSATLSFWHTQYNWSGDQDELRIYYKTSAGGTWNLLQTYTDNITVWTQRTITLSNLTNDYYIAFEGDAKYGYGVCIDDVNITVSAGCTPPTTQASNFNTSAITNTTMTVGWTRGNGNNVLVVARAGSPVNADPVSGTTYTANAAFGSGSQIGTGNYVVYNGTGTSVNVTALTAGTTYHYAIYEYSTTGTCYKTPGLTGNATTTSTCTPPTTQATNFNSSAITNTTMTVGWTRGNGNNVLVVARAGSAVNADPVNGTSYTANAAFGSGSQIGTGNYVVYSGTGNSVNITALTAGTTYHYAIYEFATTGICYLTPGLTGNATTTGTPSCSYCVPTATTDDNTGITSVSFNTINNTSLGAPAYTDFTTISTTLTKGQTYNLTVRVNTDGNYTVQTRAWIDWNKNCTFDASEEYNLGSAVNVPDGQTSLSPLSITVPTDAVVGTTTMRIRTVFGSTAVPTACNNQNYSEAEDYSIEVVAAGTPGLWTGVTSTNWNTGSNWSNGSVPTSTVDVTIPSGCTNYPVINGTATCQNLNINNGATLTVTTSGNLTVNGSLQNGEGVSGIFTINGGNCNITGNYYSAVGSTTNISGGNFSLVNWSQNSTTQWSKGTINLSGGTINASGIVSFSSSGVTGSMTGNFTFNIGDDLYINHNGWTTVTGGTINMLGTGTSPYYVLPSNVSYSAIGYNLNFNGDAADNFYICRSDGSHGLIIKNNLSITSGVVYAVNGDYALNNFDIDGSLNITANGRLSCDGTIDANINVAGNWTNNGIFNPGSNTVILDGATQTISGTTEFYNLTKNISSATTLNFEANKLQTVNNILNLNGVAGQLLSLRSTITGTQWQLNPQGTRNISYVDVKDGNNISATVINPANSINSGNNTNWFSTPPVANFSASPTTICAGNSVSYTDLSTNVPTSWYWTFNGGTPATSTLQNPTVTYNTGGNYNVTLTVSNAYGSNTKTETNFVTVNALPAAAGNISGTASVCQGQSNVSYSVPTIANATSYNWSYSGTGATINGSTNNVTINFAANATSGNLTVQGINGCGNGNVSANYTISVNQLPIAPTSLFASNNNFCSGESTTLSYNGGSGSEFKWYTSSCGNGFVGSGNNLNVMPAITTTYYGRWENGCGNSNCENMVVIVREVPTANAGSDVTICEGQNAIFVATGGTSFAWNTGVSTPNLEVYPTTTTTYTVIVTNAVGCTDADEVVATVNPKPATPVIIYDAGILSSDASEGNQWYYNGTPITGANNQYYEPTENGNYYVIINNIYGCYSDASNVINVIDVGVNSLSALHLQIYPNPNDGKFYINLSGISKNCQLSIINAQGQLVYAENNINEATSNIVLNEFAKGIYYLRLITNDNIVVRKIIVK